MEGGRDEQDSAQKPNNPILTSWGIKMFKRFAFKTFNRIPFRGMLQRRKETIQDQASEKYPPKYFVRELFTNLGNSFFVFLSKYIFKVCSHIQSNTQKRNPIFKTTIYNTNYSNDTKILSNKTKQIGHFQTTKTFKFLFCINSIIHILNFLYIL